MFANKANKLRHNKALLAAMYLLYSRTTNTVYSPAMYNSTARGGAFIKQPALTDAAATTLAVSLCAATESVGSHCPRSIQRRRNNL